MNAKQFISERIAPKTIKDDMHFMCTVSELLSLLDDYAAQCVAELEESNRKLSEELKVTEGLYRERQRVLEAIPECNVHGDCIPHALEWIEKMKAIELTAPDESRYVLPDHVQEALNSGDGIYRP